MPFIKRFLTVFIFLNKKHAFKGAILGVNNFYIYVSHHG